MIVPDIEWAAVFGEVLDQPDGAADDEIEEFLSTAQQPLSAVELAYLKKSHAEPDRWKIPDGQLPPAYLSLLRWSNGGEFRNSERLFHFFPALDETHGVRVMMLEYGVPYYTPGILPFAFNGGAVFYAFDMRLRADSGGEYPIVAAECGHSHSPMPVAASFLDVCSGHRDIIDLWDEEDEITRPMCDDCGEYLVCPECGHRGPTVHG